MISAIQDYFNAPVFRGDFSDAKSPCSDCWKSVGSSSPQSEWGDDDNNKFTPARSHIINEVDAVSSSPIESDVSASPTAVEICGRQEHAAEHIMETFMEAVKSPSRKIRAQCVSIFEGWAPVNEQPITATPLTKSVYKEDVEEYVNAECSQAWEPDSDEKLRVISRFGNESTDMKIGKSGLKRSRAVLNIISIAACLLLLIPLFTVHRTSKKVHLLNTALHEEAPQVGSPTPFADMEPALPIHTAYMCDGNASLSDAEFKSSLNSVFPRWKAAHINAPRRTEELYDPFQSDEFHFDEFVLPEEFAMLHHAEGEEERHALRAGFLGHIKVIFSKLKTEVTSLVLSWFRGLNTLLR